METAIYLKNNALSLNMPIYMKNIDLFEKIPIFMKIPIYLF